MRVKEAAATALTLALGLTAAVAPSPGAAEYPPEGDFVRGARLWAENCSRCHNIRDPRELRDDQWITTVYHMRVRGGLTGQDVRDIYTFLRQSN